MPMIKNMGSEEQHKMWMDDIVHMRIHGCYAQTELGHGSNVAALQTTATFDAATDELVLHTPSDKAYKFWPGELGKLASHAVVFARLISKGEDHGVQPFFCRIRDENHHPLPGIDVGDIGLKFGYQMKDNGFLGFNQFRIPRENLLMRYSHLSREGEFKRQGNPKYLYSVLTSSRLWILKGSGL
jgi:acyl-CoA oxidase